MPSNVARVPESLESSEGFSGKLGQLAPDLAVCILAPSNDSTMGGADSLVFSYPRGLGATRWATGRETVLWKELGIPAITFCAKSGPPVVGFVFEALATPAERIKEK